MEQNRCISLLGSTGSIGRQSLDVIAACGMRVAALTANRDVEQMEKQCRRFQPELAVMMDPEAAASLRLRLADTPIRVAEGMEGLLEAASLEAADTVLTAVVGIVGLRPTLAAIRAGKRIALANKETLVCAGELVSDAAAWSGSQVVPVDSEHSAIFQCLQGCQDRGEVRRLILTASGGPFWGWKGEDLAGVTVEQALAHPNWNMGAKISVDSATMMNKALEVVEAFHLYGVPLEKITVLVHPQSLVHSLVQFTDGSQLAQLGTPDMRIPIAACLFWPRCVDTGVPPLDLVKAGTLQFFAPDDEAFPALKLARRALRERGGMSVVMNAANEAAVELFLSGKCAFADIADLVSAAMDAHAAGEPGHEPFCPPLSCSGDDSLALEREVTILTERMSRLDLKTRELVKQLARAGVDEC